MKLNIIIFTLAIFTYATKCPKIKDGTSKIISEETCLMREKHSENNFTYHVKECKNDKICHLENRNNERCVSYIPRRKYPGEYCNHSDECANDICTVNHKCYGAPKDSLCRRHEDCDYDSGCEIKEGENIGKCVGLQRIGKCINGLCDPPTICNMGECVQFGSKHPGDPADNWMACTNFYLHEGKCIGDYNLIKDSPKEGICKYQYENGTVTFEEKPVCGNNSDPFCNEPRKNVNISNVLFAFNH